MRPDRSSETAADEQPDVYFPILDRIAEGYFDDSTNDEQLYNRFLHLLRSDQLITDPESLSSINLALSVRNAAPRVEAHYHYYANKILPSLEGHDCETWMELAGQAVLRSGIAGRIRQQTASLPKTSRSTAYLGPIPRSVATLYCSITTSQDFRGFHKTAVQSVRDGKSRYRNPPQARPASKRDPLVMSGYGVELAFEENRTTLSSLTIGKAAIVTKAPPRLRLTKNWKI